MNTNRQPICLGHLVRMIKNAVTHKLILLVGCLFVSAWAVSAQHPVSGTVKDQTGEPLSGVSVLVKNGNTTSGTVTDLNGYYKVETNGTATLEFSFIGFKTVKVTVGNRTVIDILMEEDNNLLDEVVVVGYGTQKKINLTGAVGVVDSKAFESVPVANAVQALQGQVPGLNISSNQGGGLNQKQSINIRGVGTIGEGSTGSALVLIDGMEGDIYSINPQDIESISVLKDAAASSIYGSRAPFGVILVTTKKGKAGKAQVNYNNSFRISNPIHMPASLDAYTFALYYNDAAYNSGWGPYNWVSEERIGRIKDYMAGKITNSTIPVPNNPSLWADGYSQGNDNIDYYGYFFKDNVFAHEHNVSVTGGSDKIQYYLSANYLGQDGELRVGNEYANRYTTVAKINARLSKAVSVGFNTRFIRGDYVQPSHLNDSFFAEIGRQCWPTKPLYDPNGILYDDHVLLMKNGGERQERNTWLYQQVNVTVEPLAGWRLIGDLNYRYNTQFTHWDNQTVHQTGVDGKLKGNTWNNDSRVHEEAYASDYFNINLRTDYTKTFAKAHHLKVLFGFQAEQNNYKDLSAEKLGIIYPSKPTINTSTGMDSNNQKVAPGVSGGHTRWATAGFFGRVNYDYLEKYLMEVNLRYDGSSRFRSDSRWGFFPSVSLGWNIARENFFQPLTDVLNTLKIRGSYGSLGNQNTSSLYPTYSTIGTGTGYWIIDGTLANIAWAPSLVSYNLSWEKIRTWNMGVDFGLFNNRLTGSFDYYIRKTDDMVGPSEKLPVTLGTAVPSSNNTNLRTNGWELEVMWKDGLANGLNYSARFTLADSRTKITRYSNPSGLIDGYYAGKYVGEIWGYETLGIARTEQEMEQHLLGLAKGGQTNLGQDWKAGDIMYKDLNGDGKIDAGSRTLEDHGDLKRIGNVTPRYNVGLELAADWKGFDVRMFWQGTLKRDYFQGSYYFWGANGRQGPWFSTALKGHENYFRNDENSPLGVNLDAYYPRPLFNTDKNQQVQTRYLQNASYLRLKNLQIGYSLPYAAVRKMGMQNLRIFASGENLLTITNLIDFFDPESIEGGSWGHGNVYPLSRTYSFGLNVTF